MFALFVGMSTVMGLVLPDRAESYPHAMTMLANFMAAAVPSIDSYVLVSSFPVVTKMFLAVQWLSVPLLVALIGLFPSLTEPNQKTLHRFSRFTVCLMIIALVALCVVGPATVSAQPEDLGDTSKYGRTVTLVSESRLWMGLIGSSVIFTAAYMIALAISYVRVLFGPRSG